MVELLEARIALAADIQTDFPNYSTGQTVWITASNLSQGEVIRLQVQPLAGQALSTAEFSEWHVADGSDGDFEQLAESLHARTLLAHEVVERAVLWVVLAGDRTLELSDFYRLFIDYREPLNIRKITYEPAHLFIK